MSNIIDKCMSRINFEHNKKNYYIRESGTEILEDSDYGHFMIFCFCLFIVQPVMVIIKSFILGNPDSFGTAIEFIITLINSLFSAPICGVVAFLMYKIGLNKIAFVKISQPIMIGIVARIICFMWNYWIMNYNGTDYLFLWFKVGDGGIFEFLIITVMLMFLEGLVIKVFNMSKKCIKRL